MIPKTPMGRFMFVLALLKPEDDEGNPLPPLISEEAAWLLLETYEKENPPGDGQAG